MQQCHLGRACRMRAKSLQSFPTLCDPMDYSPPAFPVHGILQARILEWAGCHALLQGIFLTQGSNLHLMSPATAGRFFTTSTTWKAHYLVWCLPNGFHCNSVGNTHRKLSLSSFSLCICVPNYHFTLLDVIFFPALSSGSDKNPVYFLDS